jgi:hypothetical protein
VVTVVAPSRDSILIKGLYGLIGGSGPTDNRSVQVPIYRTSPRNGYTKDPLGLVVTLTIRVCYSSKILMNELCDVEKIIQNWCLRFIP